MRPLSFLLLPLLTASAAAQVTITDGISPNVTNLLDFDAVPISTGPIADNEPVLAAGRITSIARIGNWFGTSDVISPGANDSGRCLVVGAGGFEIAELGDSLFSASSDAGIEFNLDGHRDEFGLLFIDQRNFDYEVELFDGPVSIGTASSVYGPVSFPVPPVHFRGPVPFDRVRITFPTGAAGVGFDDLHVGTGPPPPCVETLTTGVSTTVGSDGAVYFDLTTAGGATFLDIETKFLNAPGEPAGLLVYTTPNTHVGKENQASQWTLAARDNGFAETAGSALLTRVTFEEPLFIPNGTTGIALVGVGGMRHAYSSVANTSLSSDGRLRVTAGSSTVVPFTGQVFSPRTWNGRLCRVTGDIGSVYCVSRRNSTGETADITGYGSTSALANDLTLFVDEAPPGVFGQFLCSQIQGFTPFAGGSRGNLCLALPIGRLVGGGVIQTSPRGFATIRPDLTRLPQPTQFVVVMSGESWNFQFWFRDVVAFQQTSNYSNGLNVMFE